MTPRTGSHPLLSSVDRMLKKRGPHPKARHGSLPAESRASRREDRAGLDPDVLQCRQERTKRAGKPDPALIEARASFERLLAAEAILRKGGRPKVRSDFKGRDSEIRL